MNAWGLRRLRELAGDVDQVFDVGGNVGAFAWSCRQLWPDARIVSFEPVPVLAEQNQRNANGRWHTEEVAISDEEGAGVVHYCANQHSASTMQGASRLRAALGIRDTLEPVDVTCRPLDHYLAAYPDATRMLVKVDTEGHELAVLEGATETLYDAVAVVVECQNHPDVFDGAPTPGEIDDALSVHGLRFAGVLDTFTNDGAVWQFDGLWLRR